MFNSILLYIYKSYMGNKGAKGITKDGEITQLDPTKFKLPNVLDHIATKYILTQNFKDLQMLRLLVRQVYLN